MSVDSAHVFTTRSLPEDKRVELWEDHNLHELITLRCRTLGGGALEASMVNLHLDHLHLARVEGNAHVIERTPELVRAQPSDAIAVYLTLMGEAFFYHEDAVRTVRPGQLLICDVDRPFMRGFSQGLEELAIKVPRETFRDLTGRATVDTPQVMDFSQGSSEARTLARLVGRAVRPEDARPVEEHVVLQLMADLLTGRPGDTGTVHLVTARAFIDEHAHDPGLTAARVADAIGISERHLSRVFAASGSSVPQYILSRRLERAHALLAAEPCLTVAEVAARAGFGSATYFSHAFRDRYGERATDVRRQARARKA
ncbi:helix-turn-helix domain-containing protein [Nocardioides sp. Kera G14]|uniref:helix-turn-helix domain-containing protein n=1 Tax=Nocardioides sp. Kera G14 TaxID=2884264 RepID=UPI001D0F713C|nr:helix-turn-helix domain-containing protein [Nocardioides sp. Kera G14]UDY23404.1 helix-turn-helix domain-containing protein [Nocardioides sp. Kera G14]